MLTLISSLLALTIILTPAVSHATSNDCKIRAAKKSVSVTRQFESVYEPSGAQLLPDGRLLIVEDEMIQSIIVAAIRDDGCIAVQPLRRGFVLDWIVGNPILGKTDDLEGVAIDGKGYIYAVTSHTKIISQSFDKSREKLVRFKVEGDRIVDPRETTELRASILKQHKSLFDTNLFKKKRQAGFNIEGLSFDKEKSKLLIALRSPLIDGQAVIVVLNNPTAVFDQNAQAEISEHLTLLDLDQGGIRGIVFDPHLNGFLILSRREDKKSKSFKLWFWDGDVANQPRRIKFKGSGAIEHAEGITPVFVNGKARLLVVVDDGSSIKRAGGHYVLLNYEALKIEDRH